MPLQDQAPMKEVDLEPMSRNLKEGDRYVVNHGEGLTTVDFDNHVILAEKEGVEVVAMGSGFVEGEAGGATGAAQGIGPVKQRRRYWQRHDYDRGKKMRLVDLEDDMVDANIPDGDVALAALGNEEDSSLHAFASTKARLQRMTRLGSDGVGEDAVAAEGMGCNDRHGRTPLSDLQRVVTT
ncbi:hypothetical protein GW17_00031890 [Ensete ventricosum]|nr:hypothetical protein GW17_00031890 [Ensete ventricosum]